LLLLNKAIAPLKKQSLSILLCPMSFTIINVAVHCQLREVIGIILCRLDMGDYIPTDAPSGRMTLRVRDGPPLCWRMAKLPALCGG
jgi:hypothetical protein